MPVEFCTVLPAPVSSAAPALQAGVKRQRMTASIASAARDHLNIPGPISRIGSQIAVRTPNISDISSVTRYCCEPHLLGITRSAEKESYFRGAWYRLP